MINVVIFRFGKILIEMKIKNRLYYYYIDYILLYIIISIIYYYILLYRLYIIIYYYIDYIIHIYYCYIKVQNIFLQISRERNPRGDNMHFRGEKLLKTC